MILKTVRYRIASNFCAKYSWYLQYSCKLNIRRKFFCIYTEQAHARSCNSVVASTHEIIGHSLLCGATTWNCGSIQGLESTLMASFPREIQFNSCVRGYYVYQDRWLPVQDETLACQHEEGNVYNPFAVMVVKFGVIVGHVPRRISSTYLLFLRHGGAITCKRTDPEKWYSRDLEQGGLEIPCVSG